MLDCGVTSPNDRAFLSIEKFRIRHPVFDLIVADDFGLAALHPRVAPMAQFPVGLAIRSTIPALCSFDTNLPILARGWKSFGRGAGAYRDDHPARKVS